MKAKIGSKLRSYQLSAEALKALRELSQDSKTSMTAVIEKLLLEEWELRFISNEKVQS